MLSESSSWIFSINWNFSPTFGKSNFLKSKSIIKYGTFIKGESIFENKIIVDKGILVFGNEANGISENLRSILDVELTIPRFNSENYPESLNLSN